MEAQGTAAPQTTTTQTQDAKSGGKAPVGAAGGQESQKQGESAAQAAAKEAARKLKIKYEDNREEEVDEEEVIRTYKERKGHQRAANKELQEGRAARKQAEEFIAMLKDPRKAVEVLKKLGHDPRKMSEEYLAEVLQEEMMDPKEKELKQTKQRLTEYEEREKQAKEAQEKAELEEMTAKIQQKYQAEFIDALKSTKLPPNKETVKKMAAYVGRCANIGVEITAAEAAQLVLEDVERMNAAILRDADPETIIRLLGDDGLSKIRSFESAKLKNPEAGLKTPTEQIEQRRSKRASGPMTAKEWREFNRK